MNRRRTILLLCTILPLFLLSCQTYTASRGKAAIEPIASVSEEKTITKYSILQEEEKALLKEKALQEEQERALVIEQEQKDKEKSFAALAVREKELKNSLEALNAQLEKATEENQQLVDTLTELSLEKEEALLSSQSFSQESALQIEALTQQNAQLSNEIFELQSLIEENRVLQQEQKAERLRLEQEQEQLLAEQEEQRVALWQELIDERDALASEKRMLKAQLEEKTLTIEEKLRLETLRDEEAKRLEQEKLAKRMEQEALEKRIASENEAKRQALEKEWRQIPPLEQITYPRLYKTDKPTSLAKEGEKLRVLMLPLDDVPWNDNKIVTEVHKSISDLQAPIIFVTGHMENVIALVREMRSQAALFSTGAIITSFPIQKLSTYSAEIQYQETKSLRLIVANLPEYQVAEEFVKGGFWQATQKELTENRIKTLKHMVGEGSLTEATLLGASLYEPSYRDWNTFSPVTYRQIDYLWPLSDFLESEGFYDTYRLTHFSEATNTGNTLDTPNWSERVDFIYSRKILPLESAMLTIGGESAPDEAGISRFGVLGTFLVP